MVEVSDKPTTRWLEVAGGTLERNTSKERDNQPDYKGKLKFNCDLKLLEQISGAGDEAKMFISGWQKEGEKDGQEYKFMSLSVSYPIKSDEVTKDKQSVDEEF